MIKIKKGLDLPIKGAPDQSVIENKSVKRVALIGEDYWWFKPTMAVNEGDTVKKGQLLFSCKRGEGIRFTAPASGKVVEVNRGAKRFFESMVIEIAGDDSVTFENYSGSDTSSYDAAKVQALLVESGLWTSLRTRPYSFVARLDEKPQAVFVTAMDTNPLAPDANLIIGEQKEAFAKGLEAIKKLAPKTFVCSNANSDIPKVDGITYEQFDGPHPAGNAGTHINFLSPVGGKNLVWHLGYQDLIAIGKLFETGELFTQRVISLAGPLARKPRLIRTQLGASIEELTQDEFYPFGKVRVISGSVFNGRTSTGKFTYLGKYHQQITVLKEGFEREFFGWHSPGLNRFSVKNIYVSRFFKSKLFSFTTNVNGSDRSLVPIGSFEKVMPLDIFPTHLLKAILSNDDDKAIELGIMELDEEDLSLCTFVDPCKHEFGPKLRASLEHILKEG
jgi:Na+-transporting NADH:ubiquinone oxidoreductase subunit A